MLVIRDAQRSLLAKTIDEGFIETAFGHIQAHFGDLLAVRREDVVRALGRARSLGFDSHRLQWRFLHLAAVAGWDFCERPQSRWLVDILTDVRISSGADRLERAVDELRYRATTQAANTALARSTSASSSPAGRRSTINGGPQ